MNKKGIIIGACCAAAVLLVVIIIALAAGGKSPKSVAKKLGPALQSEAKLEKFCEKNIDYKALVALKKVMTMSYEDLSSSEKVAEAFKKQYKEASKDDVKEIKKDIKDSIKEYVVDKKLKLKECGDLEKEDGDGMEDFQTMKVTYVDEDDKEYEYTLSFYKKKLVSFSPASSFDL